MISSELVVSSLKFTQKDSNQSGLNLKDPQNSNSVTLKGWLKYNDGIYANIG